MLIVEDGDLSRSDANSYIDIPYLQRYALLTGSATLGGSPAPDDLAMEQGIYRGMAYVEMLEPRWQGYRVNSNQPLAWPRTYVYPLSVAPDYLGVFTANQNSGAFPSNAVPNDICKAVAEAALREIASPGSLQPDFPDGASSLTSSSIRVGPISESQTWSAGGSGSRMPEFPALINLVRKYMGSRTTQMVRAR